MFRQTMACVCMPTPGRAVMHRQTPIVTVTDPLRVVVRDIAYHRRSDKDAPQARITHQIHDTLNRVSFSRDPRLFALFESGASQSANQTTVSSLTGRTLLSINTDAGWRLTLSGAAGQRLEDWDQKLNHLRTAYDSLMRPESGFVLSAGEERRTACFAYADASLESARHNRCGQLIRHDDSAGTRRFCEYSLLGAHREQSRSFLEHLGMPDWPEDEAERDKLLEPQRATTRMNYNSVGELVRHVDALGNEQFQRQTVAGNLYETRMTLAGVDEDITLVGDIRYNAFGQIEQQTAGNGVVTRTTFHPENGWLKTLRAQVANEPPFQNLAYDYDPVGNPVRISDAAQPVRYFRNQRVAAINTYQYDTLGQLIGASGRQRVQAPGGPHLPAFISPPDSRQLENYLQTFDYDAGGNLEVLHHHAESGNRTERTAVATLSNRSLPWGEGSERPGDDEIDAAYDVNGNLKTLQRGQTLQWDTCNCLRQVDRVIREEEPDDVESYIYDGDGQRVRKVRIAYTGTLNRTHETRYLPGVEIRTTPDETLHVISVQAGRCTVQILHWEERLARGIPPNQLRYCLSDHLGSSSLELDKDAALISQETYYPYGATAWWAGRENVEARYKTIRYSGHERDATGLYYYGFRYYMPWRQRWLNADPCGIADGLNLYRMVGNNPVRFVDAQGLAGDDLSLMEQGGPAGQRTSTVKWAGAHIADMARGGLATSTGELARLGITTLLETTAGSTVRGANAVVSAVAHGYAGGGLAESYIRVHRFRSRFATIPIRFAGFVGGAGVGATVGYLSPTPLGDLANIASRTIESGMSRMTSGVGASIQYTTPSGGWSVVFEGGANLASGIAEGAYLPSLSGLHPVLKGFINGALKQLTGATIRSLGNVDASYTPSSEFSLSDWDEIDAGLRDFAHATFMDITYSNSMEWIVIGIEGNGHESLAQSYPVTDSILHTINPIAELDPLIGQRVRDGYSQQTVAEVPRNRKFKAVV